MGFIFDRAFFISYIVGIFMLSCVILEVYARVKNCCFCRLVLAYFCFVG